MSESLCFQRYSVAVYLVRVFTAADLFSQLKLCSVENADRCRERSKSRFITCLNVTKVIYKHYSILLKRKLSFITDAISAIFLQFKTNYVLTQKVK